MKVLSGAVLLWTAAFLQLANGGNAPMTSIFALANPGQVITEMSGDVTIPILVNPNNIVDPSANFVQILATTNHGTTDDGDFTPLTSAPFTGTPVQGGDTIINVTISLLDDSTYEADKAFALAVSAAGNLQPLLNSETFNLAIVDDELQPVDLNVPPTAIVPEHAGELPFGFGFADGNSRPVDYTFWITFTGSPANGADAAEIGTDVKPAIVEEMIVIPSGETWVMKPFNISDDTDAENSEHFEITVYGNTVTQNFTTSIYIKDNDALKYFSCDRFGQEGCGNGSCNPYTCDCMCDAGYEGYECNIKKNTVVMPPATCDVTCINGTCVNESGTHMCVCDEGFTGLACEKTAYYVTCDDDYMMVCLDVAGDFQGNAFLFGKPSCAIDGTDPSCSGVYARFPLMGDGECVPTFDNTSTPARSELAVYIQFNPIANTGDNQAVLMHCNHQGEGNYTIGEADPGVEWLITDPPVGQSPVTQNPPITVTGSIDAGTSTLTGPFLQPITATTSVVAGTVLEYCFTAKDTTGGFRFEGITLYNGIVQGTPLYHSIQLFKADGCRSNPNDGIVRTDIAGDNFTKCFKFEAVKLNYTSVNQILSNVRVFAKNAMFTDNLCQGAGRRKRQAAEDESEGTEGTVGVTYMVTDTEQSETQQLLQECERSLMLPATIGLAIVCFTLLVIVILLAATVIRNNRYKTKI